MRYSKQFKESVVKEYHLSGMSNRCFSKRVGIDKETLRRWSNEVVPDAKTLIDMKYLNKNINDKDANWNALEKFNAVVDYEKLSESERGIFLRRNGLYTSNIKKWQQEMMSGMDLGTKKIARINQYEQQLRAQKAVIELQKKVHKYLADVE